MNRRGFALGLGGAALSAAMPEWGSARRDPSRYTILYNAVGDRIMHWAVDVAAGTLAPRGAITLPAAVQYAWFHPNNRFLYAATGDPAAGAEGVHRLCALRIAKGGAPAVHGDPVVLEQRPIHVSVDVGGRFAFVCHTVKPFVTVCRINGDGTLGPRVAQPETLDFGIFPHQMRMLPDRRSVALVSRGNDPHPGKGEDPGSLRQFRLQEGRLAPLGPIAEGNEGLGYGPRHLDFHSSRPWAYVAVERQNQIHMHRIGEDGLVGRALFRKPTTGPHLPGIHQAAGAIHIHPRGHVVYVSNRSNGLIAQGSDPIVQHGDNSIAVFTIDQATGEPQLVQTARLAGFHPRTFAIDPSGSLLAAATMQNVDVWEGDTIRRYPKSIILFRIAADGQLTMLRSHPIDGPEGERQMWCAMIA